MRKLTADFILHPRGTLVKRHTLTLDENGTVTNLSEGVDAGAECFEGILCPGFINTHCHLELSYLYKSISKNKGLTGFINEFVKERKPANKDTEDAAIIADAILWKNGIQAVGDICNDSSTFKIKALSPIRYHSFIELFNLHPAQAEATFKTGVELFENATSLNLSSSIVPHAPYTVPGLLHELICKQSELNKSLWCIHNQETVSEDELFEKGTGKLAEFFSEMGFNHSWIQPEGKTSLQTTSNYFPTNSNLLLVHNIYTTQIDIDFLKTKKALPRTWFALCPKANLYIENRLPDILMFVRNHCNLTIGTDSLASNDNLSVLEEVKTIHRAFPTIPISELLTWATKNGADYFGWLDLGRFEKGARPGVVNITGADDEGMRGDVGVKRVES